MKEKSLFLYSIGITLDFDGNARSSIEVLEMHTQFEGKDLDSDIIWHLSNPVSYDLFKEKPEEFKINSKTIKEDKLSTIVYVDLVSSQNYLENKKDLESKAIDIALEEYEKYYLSELERLENIRKSVRKELNNLKN